ncbi:MAG TPA: guanylate kinase [Bacillota bacterium]|nr:guanylate kinase [Bacillota bacterium]
MDKKGMLLVFSGPSGAGKGTVCKALLEDNPNLLLSVSATTRPPRTGEIDGVNYFFLKHDQFEKMIEDNQLLEWAKVYGNYYGTPGGFVQESLAQGYDVILEIDTQGALQVKEKIPEAVLIFIAPPSFFHLRERLTGRRTDSEDDIKRRLSSVAEEMKMASRYDYIVVNDDVEKAANKVCAIISAEKSRSRHFNRFISQFTQQVRFLETEGDHEPANSR